MNEKNLLTAASLLSVLLFTIHLTDDIIRGMAGGKLENLGGVGIPLLWAYVTLMARERTWGRILILLGGIFAAAMPVLHMRGRGIGGAFAQTPGAFRFILVLHLIGVTGGLAVILSIKGIMSARAHANSDRRG